MPSISRSLLASFASIITVLVLTAGTATAAAAHAHRTPSSTTVRYVRFGDTTSEKVEVVVKRNEEPSSPAVGGHRSDSVNNNNNIETNDTTTTTAPPPTPNPSPPVPSSEHTMSIVIVICHIPALLLLIGCIIWARCRRKAKEEEYRLRFPHLMAEIDSSTKNNNDKGKGGSSKKGKDSKWNRDAQMLQQDALLHNVHTPSCRGDGDGSGGGDATGQRGTQHPHRQRPSSIAAGGVITMDLSYRHGSPTHSPIVPADFSQYQRSRSHSLHPAGSGEGPTTATAIPPFPFQPQQPSPRPPPDEVEMMPMHNITAAQNNINEVEKYQQNVGEEHVGIIGTNANQNLNVAVVPAAAEGLMEHHHTDNSTAAIDEAFASAAAKADTANDKKSTALSLQQQLAFAAAEKVREKKKTQQQQQQQQRQQQQQQRHSYIEDGHHESSESDQQHQHHLLNINNLVGRERAYTGEVTRVRATTLTLLKALQESGVGGDVEHVGGGDRSTSEELPADAAAYL